MFPIKPTILIVHGAWHVPLAYNKLATALRSAGYEVHVPHLATTNGTKSPHGDLVTDAALVRSCAEDLIKAGHTIAALMHSYGGQVGTNALHGLDSRTRAQQGLAGGVSNLIYLCAFILPEGWALLDHGRSRGPDNRTKLNYPEEGYCEMEGLREKMINTVKDDAEAEAYLSTLVPWSTKPIPQPLSQCAWKDSPVTYIYTTLDNTVPLASQQMMVERATAHGLQDPLLVVLEADHCPHFTATGQVVDAINQAVGATREVAA